MLPVLQGCAVANIGTLAAEVTQANGAKVIDVYALGIYLRTQGFDRGLNAGYSKRSYIYRADAVKHIKPGSYYFHLPVFVAGVVSKNLLSYGIDLTLEQPEPGIVFGYQAMSIMADVATEESVDYYLDYRSDLPEKTIFISCGEGKCLPE